MRDFLCSLLSGYFLFNKIWIMVEWIFARRNIWNLYCPTSVYQRSHTMLALYHRLREHWLSLEGHCGRLFWLRTHTVRWKILRERSPWCRVDLIQKSFWKCSSKGRYCNSGNPHRHQRWGMCRQDVPEGRQRLLSNTNGRTACRHQLSGCTWRFRRFHRQAVAFGPEWLPRQLCRRRSNFWSW